MKREKAITLTDNEIAYLLIFAMDTEFGSLDLDPFWKEAKRRYQRGPH